MKQFFLDIYREKVPYRIRKIVLFIRVKVGITKRPTKELLDRIILYYEKRADLNTGEKEALKYLKDKKVLVQYPGNFIDKYNPDLVNVLIDKGKQLKYVLHRGRKLYFPKSMKNYEIKGLYNELSIEQDTECAHCYFNDNFNVSLGDTFIDIGAAEGIIALNIVERASKIYLLECDPKWVEALNATFEPYKDKVEIIQKFVSDTDSENEVKLDTLTRDLKGNISLKIDTEGMEKRILEGARDLLSRYNLQLALCTYHKKEDEKEFTELLLKLGYNVNFSNGYMIPFCLFNDDEEGPFLRKGVLRANKNN